MVDLADRQELYATASRERQARLRDMLEANEIEYVIRAESDVERLLLYRVFVSRREAAAAKRVLDKLS